MATKNPRYDRPPTVIGSPAPAPTPTAPAPPPVPTMSFEEAVRQYQGRYPGGATNEAYLGLYPYLEGLGFQVERPTRGGGRLSDDKIVDRTTGQVYDVIHDKNEETGAGSWSFGTAGYWVNGAPSATPPPPWSLPPATPAPPGTPPPATAPPSGPGTGGGSRTPPKPHDPPVGGPGHDTSRTAPGGQGPVPGSTATTGLNRIPNPYAAAWDAARRRRGMAGAGGRRSTIIGGFGGGTPLTRPAILGRTR